MTNDTHDPDIRRWFVGAFGATLVAMGGLGFVKPEAGASSTAPAYDAFHIFGGVVALALAKRGRPTPIRAFLVGFGAIDLYQALASHRHWFPESQFRWTPTDDRLHLTVGTLLVILGVLGAWPRCRKAG